MRENNGYLLFLAIIFGAIGIACGSGIFAIGAFVIAGIFVALYFGFSFGIV